MKAGLIVAMTSEYEALRQAGISGVVRSGIGKVSAARAATEMILRDRPDCIINSGCAGGLSPAVDVCDIVVGARTAYHDVWCGEGNLKGQVQGLPQLFEADPDLVRTALAVQATASVHCGLICTGDQFLTSREDDARVLEIYPDALACDMESAAIAQVCLHYGVPFLSFRIVSDTRAGGRDHQAQYDDFWKHVSGESFDFLRTLVESL